MMALQWNHSRGGQARRAGALALVLLSLILTSCFGSSTKPGSHTLTGHVVLIGTALSDVGDTIGVQRYDAPESVQVYLYQGAALRDSARTVGGAYTFHGVANGSYQVISTVWPGVGDTLSVTNLTADAAVDTLHLVSSPTMSPMPNPFPSSTRVLFAVHVDGLVDLIMRKPSGLTVRNAIHTPLPSGLHAYIWDGKDDAANDLPPGPYWVVFQEGADYRAVLAVKVVGP